MYTCKVYVHSKVQNEGVFGSICTFTRIITCGQFHITNKNQSYPIRIMHVTQTHVNFHFILGTFCRCSILMVCSQSTQEAGEKWIFQPDPRGLKEHTTKQEQKHPWDIFAIICILTPHCLFSLKLNKLSMRKTKMRTKYMDSGK